MRPAPVTMATFPVKSPMGSSLFDCRAGPDGPPGVNGL